MTCEHCGETVRFGWRHGAPGWWHRHDPDHTSVAPVVAERVVVIEPLPPVEVRATPVEVDSFPARSGIRQIANLVLKTPGWELVNIHHARGPYFGGKGEVLSISDTHVLRARGSLRVDGSRPVAVASWRDLKFDFAFIGAILNGHLDPRKVSSTEMKDWIKTAHDQPQPDDA